MGRTEEVKSSNTNTGPNVGQKTSLFNRMVGSSNKGDITICGVPTKGLIDSGSMITSISESFYNNLNPLPQSRDIKEFGLSVLSANGDQLPYKGYIEAEISIPSLGNNNFVIPLLVVSNTEYNSTVPAIIGTNVIRFCRQSRSQSGIPVPEE